MKIGIITFHFVSNYGAVLQCYALQEYLKGHGYNVEVINYRPSYHTVRYSGYKNPFLVARENWIRNKDAKIIRRIYIYARGFIRGFLLSVKQTDRIKYNLFNEFINKYLQQTRIYRSLRALKNDPPKDEIYIAGSDQLWNPDFTDFGFDRAYFLDFGPPTTKRLSYAVSLKENYTEKEMEQLLFLTEKLNAISIRERNNTFENNSEQTISICIDPTLLLNEEDYSQLEKSRLISEPYVFVYGLQDSKDLNCATEIISKSKKLKIINGTPHRTKIPSKCECVYNYGPEEFLAYIKYADFVITNSFHGTAFSIIYKRQFIVIPHTHRGKRMKELLGKLNLSRRIWDEEEGKWDENIDYRAVFDELEKLRVSAKEYFENNLLLFK